MVIKISYFYNIRFFEPWQVPLSTAVWDPKWYRKNGHPYIDKRGVICGLRLEELNPKSVNAGGCPCKVKNPESCWFLKSYRAGLDKINFNELYIKLSNIASLVQEQTGHEAELILMVYETPLNPCSERQPLIDWFKKHGFEVTEFTIPN